jgi:tol-pal system protein YbgF
MLNTCRQPDRSAKNFCAMTSLIHHGLTAAVLAAGLCLSTVAPAQDSGGNLLDRMFGKPSEVGAPPGGQEPTPEQVMRIERLEAQIRQMTGTIEQLQYRNQQLENQIRGMGGQVGQSGPAGQVGMQQPVQPPPGRPVMQAGPPSMSSQPMTPPAPIPGRRADVFDPSQNPNAPGAPRPLGGPQNEPPPIITSDEPVGAPGGRAAGGPLDLSTLASGAPGVGAPQPGQSPGGGLPPPPSRNLSATGAVAAVAPPSESPKDTYDLGYGYVMRKDYALAEQTFRAFLGKYPTDRRAADAQFWLGESQFQRQQYDAAAQSFLDLSTKHGGHAKAPDALLRLAQSLNAMKQKEMACATLAEVGRKYPRASAGVKQGVEREQKRVHC